MRSTVSTLRPARFLCWVTASALLTGNGHAATLYGFAAEDSLVPHWTTGVNLDYGDGVVGLVSQIWSTPDPAGAAAYLMSIPESSRRDSIIGTHLLSVSMDSYGSDNEALRQAVETWSSEGLGGSGVIGDRRGRDRGTLAPGNSPETVSMGSLLLFNDTSYGSWEIGSSRQMTDWTTTPIVVVPEPSAALLGALGGLALLRRRRAS